MADFTALITDLESATEGSDKLDRRIAVTVLGWCEHETYWTGGPPLYWQCKHCAANSADGRNDRGQDLHTVPDDFTRSVDAALTLIDPPGHFHFTWCVEERVSSQRRWSEAQITVPSREFYGRSATPALAICAAALRARQEEVK